MTIRNFINRKIGKAADTKPLSQHLRTVLYFEDDTGDLYLSDGTSITLTQSKNNSEVYQNKTIDAEQNSVLDLIEYNPFAQNVQKRNGGIIPATTVPNSFYGILEDNGVMLYNSDTVKAPTNKMMVAFKSQITNDKVGFSTISPIAMRQHNYEFKIEFQSRSSLRTLIGFTATQLFPDTSNNVFGTSQIGVCVGYTNTTPFYSVFTNDGIGANQATPDPFTISKDLGMHILEIKLQSTKVTCTLDNETKDITTKIPPLTTPLYFSAYGVI